MATKSKKRKKQTPLQTAAAAILTTTTTNNKKKKKKKTRATKAPAAGLPEVLSCGVLLRQRRPVDAVLALLRHDGSPDLPKGHVKRGETDLDAALREFEEEAGISRERIAVFGDLFYESCYRTRSKKTGRPVNKTVRIFLAEMEGPATVRVDDHDDYAWLPITDRAALEATLVDNPTFLGAVRVLLTG